MSSIAGEPYSNPPVVETALGVEFSALPVGFMWLAAVHRLWNEEFPRTQEQEALPPSRPVEQGNQSFQLQWGSGLPPARLWMMTDDEHLLVQVQNDRLFLNWRKLGSGPENYPGYEQINEKFLHLFEEFDAQVLRDFDSRIVPLTVEWTYVNQIPVDGPHGDKIFSIWSRDDNSIPGESILSRFNNVRSLNCDGLHGQLTISLEPTEIGPQQPVNLTVSTQFFLTPTITTPNVFRAISRAHEFSRLAFEKITSESAKKRWRTE